MLPNLPLNRARYVLPLQVMLDRIAFGLLLSVGACFAFEFRQPLLSAAGMKLTNIELLIALTLTAWLGARILTRTLPRTPSIIAAPIGAWLTVLALSTLFAPAYQREALLFFGRTVSGVLIGWAAYDLTRSEQRVRGLMFAMASGGALVAAIGLMEAAQVAGIVRWLLNFKAAPTQIGELARVSSTLSYATITAMVLELTLLVMLTLWITNVHRWIRIALGTAIVLTLAALVLTLSRAGVLSISAALAMMAAYGAKKQRPMLIRPAAITGAVLTTFVIGMMIWNPITALRLSTETEELWYRAAYDAPASVQIRPREIISVPVSISNTSARAWITNTEKPYQLSYHLLDEHGEMVSYDGARTDLPHDVLPDQTITLQALIAAPEEAGMYIVEWDMLQDSVSWFSWKGSEVAQTRLLVAGSAVEGQALNRTAAPTEIRIITPTPTRFELWGAALRMALDYPLLGVGPDNFRWQYGRYAQMDKWNTDIHANNLYLEWLADSGFVGFAAFLWLIGTLLIYIIKRVWRSDDILALGLLASLITWFVHGLFDSFIEFTPTYVAFWLITGLALSQVTGVLRDADRV